MIDYKLLEDQAIKLVEENGFNNVSILKVETIGNVTYITMDDKKGNYPHVQFFKRENLLKLI